LPAVYIAQYSDDFSGDCAIVINMNRLPYDTKDAMITSGIRLGTPIVTKTGMGAEEMDTIAAMINSVLGAVEIISDSEYSLEKSFKQQMKEQVRHLCRQFPVF